MAISYSWFYSLINKYIYMISDTLKDNSMDKLIIG